MSYLQRIAECNQYDLSHTIPFVINQEQLGWTHRSFAEKLSRWDEVFTVSEQSVTLHSSLKTDAEMTVAVMQVFKELHQHGVIDTWVDEIYPVLIEFGETPRMHVERAAAVFLGLRSFGVHVNGLVKKSDGLYVWIAVRTKDKPFWPGKLDQMVAGGQPAGISLIDNVVKESAEEANIPEKLARQAQYITSLSYCSEGKRGISPDTLYVYDIWLPESFVPENTDGEVSSFRLIPLSELASLVENTDAFKQNCNLVNIDLLLRKGVINQDHQDYKSIKKDLYSDMQVFSVL